MSYISMVFERKVYPITPASNSCKYANIPYPNVIIKRSNKRFNFQHKYIMQHTRPKKPKGITVNKQLIPLKASLKPNQVLEKENSLNHNMLETYFYLNENELYEYLKVKPNLFNFYSFTRNFDRKSIPFFFL